MALLSLLVELLVVAGLAVALGLSTALVVVDLREHRLPNELVAALFMAGLVVAVVRIVEEDWPVIFVAFGSLGFGSPFLLINLLRPAALGFGDVKLAFCLGLFLGAFAPGTVPFALGLVALVQLLLRLALGHRTVAFGPILVGAVLICVGPPVYNYFIGISA